MSTLLQLLPGSLPENYKPETWQDFYNRTFELGRAVWPATSTKINYGSTAPTGDDINYPWIRFDPTTGVFDRVYNYKSGMWLSPHPVPAQGDPNGQYFMTIWNGSAANLVGFDPIGNTDAVATLYTGPFWEIVTGFEAKFPLIAGTLPSGTVVAVNATGGEENHVLTEPELPTITLEPGPIVRLGPTGLNLGGGSTHTQTAAPYTIGSDDPHNNMPPYKAVYLIRRTIRKYYTST